MSTMKSQQSLGNEPRHPGFSCQRTDHWITFTRPPGSKCTINYRVVLNASTSSHMHSVCSLVPRPQLQLSLLAVRIMLSVIHTASNDSCSEGLGTRLLGMCHLNSVRREATLSVFSPTLSLCAKCSGRLATVSAVH